MQIERLVVDSSPHPFPIYPDPTEELLRAHATSPDRDPVVAHILAVLSGYAYGDAGTVATMASRLGMAGSAARNPGAGQDFTDLVAAVQLRLRVAMLFN